jgi:hypothetical protein
LTIGGPSSLRLALYQRLSGTTPAGLAGFGAAFSRTVTRHAPFHRAADLAF